MTTPDRRAPEEDGPHTADSALDEPHRHGPQVEPTVVLGRPSGPAGTDPPESPPEGSALRHLGGAPWARLFFYLLLMVMASGDAFGIYLTLIDLNVPNPIVIRGFVVAITLAAVVGAHEVGRLARSRAEGRGVHPGPIVALGAAWLTVGITVAVLRSLVPFGASANTGLDAPTPGDTGLGATAVAPDMTGPIILAALLFCLYLLTGGVAMSTAYRYGSPYVAELRDLVRRRDARRRAAAEARYDEERVQAFAEEHAEERRQHEERYAPSVPEAYGEFLKNGTRYRIAGHLGSPSATDDVIP